MARDFAGLELRPAVRAAGSARRRRLSTTSPPARPADGDRDCRRSRSSALLGQAGQCGARSPAADGRPPRRHGRNRPAPPRAPACGAPPPAPSAAACWRCRKAAGTGGCGHRKLPFSKCRSENIKRGMRRRKGRAAGIEQQGLAIHVDQQVALHPVAGFSPHASHPVSARLHSRAE